jgi:CHAD domain-containing protein
MPERLLNSDQIPLLEELTANTKSDAIQRRAKILLLYHQGKDTSTISEEVGLAPRSVQHWRREFLKHGMEMFSDTSASASLDKIKEKPEPALQRKSATRKPTKKQKDFPKVLKKSGVKTDDPMAEAGRKILRYYFVQMLSNEKGTRSGKDIEALHDMRVASRRMRAAFEVFGSFLKKKAIKNHLKGLRATGRALGRVRDLDVVMEKAKQYLETLPDDERSGLDPLLNAWQQERSQERDKMLTYLDSENYRQFKQELNEFLSTPGAGSRTISKTRLNLNQVHLVAPILIYTHLGAVRSYETIISNATIEQLHALRIEIKKLRYALEFFCEVLGKQATEVIEDIKSIQDHLGSLNDADVACQILQEFIDTWEQRQIDLPLHERQNPELVIAYLATKHAERHNLMVTFPEAWAHFNRPEFRKNLALAISVL